MLALSGIPGDLITKKSRASNFSRVRLVHPAASEWDSFADNRTSGQSRVQQFPEGERPKDRYAGHHGWYGLLAALLRKQIYEPYLAKKLELVTVEVYE